MGEFLTFENLANHVHGGITHFPIGLLVVSAALDLFAGSKKRTNLHFSAWILLVIGTVGAVAATVTGLVAHLAYEEDPVLLAAIEPHQYTSFAATAIFVGLAGWRWLSLRRGADVGGTRPYLLLVLIGVIVLGVTGFLGGNLQSEWGLGVEGVTR